jgi:uncharacterized protein YxjI
MFEGSQFEVRQKFGIGTKYRIYEEGDPILESKKKKPRLKEDFRFDDADTGEERFRVRADSVLDVAAAYDIVDSETGDRIGSVKRDVASFFKHEYALLGPDGDEIGRVREDSVPVAVARRFLTTLVPFSYDIVSPAGERLGEATEAFALHDAYRIDVTGGVDPRLAVVGIVVIDAIEEN